MILCQGTSCEAFASEDYETNVVIRAISDETHRYFLRRFDTIGLEVHSEHTRGDIHREHDVNPFDPVFRPRGATLRAS